jgi:hypothetical protein
MAKMKTRHTALDKLCRTAIEQRFGSISKLPRELADCVLSVYREFMTGYLNMLRQREKKPADWIPETVSIDFELSDQMRHFFSDYQHITKKFYQLNHKMDLLLAMNEDEHPKLYHYAIDEILENFASQFHPGEKDEPKE